MYCWLMTSASAGASLRVEIKNERARIGFNSSFLKELQGAFCLLVLLREAFGSVEAAFVSAEWQSCGSGKKKREIF